MNLFVSIFKGEYTKEKFTIGLSKTIKDMRSQYFQNKLSKIVKDNVFSKKFRLFMDHIVLRIEYSKSCKPCNSKLYTKVCLYSDAERITPTFTRCFI